MRPVILNVLADRYTSSRMLNIWSAVAKILAERELWIAVMQAQQELGLDIPQEAIDSYRDAIASVDLESMRKRELVTRHDVKARIEEFNDLAGHQHAHKGMTSRDLTENVEQMQIRNALRIIREKLIAVLARLASRATEFTFLPMAGRSHNAAAQMTTLGKRFASVANELFLAYDLLERCLEDYPLRGIKGPIGTQQDMLDLLGSEEKVIDLEERIARHLGFKKTFTSVGQVYPRSLDFQVIALLVQIAAAPSSLATTIRLMAGFELVTEGFKDGQVGSTGMPHKMNARSSERINGFYDVLCGYLRMIEGPSGHQWQEGDVSCSVVRRIALPDAFMALDGLLETLLTILDEFGAYPAVADREIERYLPFLATTKLLTAAVRTGMGREDAHKCIRKHSIAAALLMRTEGTLHNPFVRKLGEDFAFPLNEDEIKQALGSPFDFIGLAESQTASVVTRAQTLCDKNPEAAAYTPEPIL